MIVKTRRKRERLPFTLGFAEDKPGQFLKAQITRTTNESYYSSSDQEIKLDFAELKTPNSKCHKRTASAVPAFDFNTAQNMLYHSNSRDPGSSVQPLRRASLGEYDESLSRSIRRPCSFDDLEMSDDALMTLAAFETCVFEESPSKEESQCLSEDDLAIIDLHTNMSKIQQLRCAEKEAIEHKRQSVKKKLLGLMAQTQGSSESQITPRVHWSIRTSCTSNATQLAAGSSFVLESIDLISATQEGFMSRGKQVCKDEESCLVKMETEDLADFDSRERPKRILTTIFKTALSGVPSPILQRALKAIETMVNSTLLILLDVSYNFQGLYRLNQTYSLLHKLAGFDSAPCSFPCSAVKLCFIFNPQSQRFTETAIHRLTAGAHAVSI